MIGTVLGDRYRLDAELGQGGTGAVYRAYDTVLERDVAVKVLSPSAIGTQGRARLLQEARLAAQLKHPNIIDIYDAGKAGDTHFIVMELLEGASLFDRRPSGLPEIISIAHQICAALGHAHSHGVIHRDLKLENVIVSPDGKATLTDFGLARSTASRLTQSGETADAGIVGTVFYLSPEQILGREMDGRADLYALGVMLYELTSGRLPFTGDDALAVLSQHLHAPVVPPSTYDPAIPPGLDRLIVRLLSKEAGERPSSAGEVASALDDLEAGTEPAVALGPLDRLVRGRLVGRDAEMAAARAFWQGLIAGSAGERVLLISGEAGVGKTPLVNEIVALAQISGGRALSGECYAEGSLPYMPFAEIVHQALVQLGDVSSLPPYVLEDLATIAPDLRVHFPQIARERTEQAMDPQAQQQRLFESMAVLGSRLVGIGPASSPPAKASPGAPAAAHGEGGSPLLLVLEDVQWADAGSLFLVRHLARRSRAAGLRLLILMTFREGEADCGCCVNDVLLDLRRERLLAEIKLRSYTLAETRALLATMFQQDPAAEFVEAIYRETEGNLFYIEEICKTLIEDGRLFREGDAWRWPALEQMATPRSVRGTIQARVGKLPETAQEVLRLAAVIGREFDFAMLERASREAGAAEWDEEALIDALEQAEAGQLIREAPQKGPESFVFTHNLIAASLREGISGLRRRRLHRRVLAALEALRPDAFAALAYQAEQAGEAERACTYYGRAAERSLAAYANQEAERFLRAGLALAGADAARPGLLASLGEAVFRQARYEEAAEIWREAIAAYKVLGDHDQVARLYARSARAAAYNNPARSLQICRNGLAAVKEMAPGAEADADPETPGMAALLHETGRAYRFNDMGQRGLPYCERALAMAQRLNLVEIQAEALATLGILPGQPPEVSRLRLLQAIELAEPAGLLMTALRAHENLGDVSFSAGDWVSSLQHRRRACELTRRVGAPRWEYIHTLRLAALLLDLGDFAECKRLLAGVPHPSGGASLSPYWLLYPRILETRLLRMAGDLAEAETRLRLYESQARDRQDAQARGEFLCTLGDVLLERGELEGAARALEQALAILGRPEASLLPQVWARCLLAQVRAQAGWAEEADQLFDEAQEQSPGYETALSEALLVLTEARLDAMQGQAAEAAVPFADAVGRFTALGARWWLARALFDWAECEGGVGEAPRAHLAEAQRLFEDVGAPYYAALASQGLAGAGQNSAIADHS